MTNVPLAFFAQVPLCSITVGVTHMLTAVVLALLVTG